MDIVLREKIEEGNKWDLSKLYSSEEIWEQDLKKVEEIDSLASGFSGTLGQSAKQLLNVIETLLSSQRLIEKIYTYAHLKSDQNTANTENLALVERALNLYSRHGQAWSFFSPELLSLSQERIDLYLEDTNLAPYKRMIENIVRFRPHILSPQEERIIAAGSEVFSSAEKTFSQLNNADLNFGDIEINGTKTPLTHSSYALILKNPLREIREKAFNQFYQVFDAHKNSIAAMLSSSIKTDVYLARIKNYATAREASLFSDNISTNVYDNLIKTVSNNLRPLHQYYQLRKNIIKLSEQRIFDTYVPIVSEVKKSFPYPEAVKIIIDSLKPLGEEYCKTLEDGLLAGRWVDRYENKGKRSGAYSSGCYDSPPYILMNYKASDIRDVFTLTHEAGHSMHSYLSIKNQAFQDHHYTIFVAEVASTFNEMLLNQHLKTLYKDDPKMIAYLINNQIDDIKATLYRQCMFAEFEYHTHKLYEENQALTIDVFRTIYCTLLKKYFGETVTISSFDELECLRIPHFYSAFYVYKYATGISAATSLSRMVLDGSKKEQERYLSFLKAGGSKHPLEVLRDAGVDMEKPEAIENTLSYFSSLVDELENTLKSC